MEQTYIFGLQKRLFYTPIVAYWSAKEAVLINPGVTNTTKPHKNGKTNL